MKQDREYLDFLDDIRAAALNARRFTAGMDYAAFVADEKTVYALLRALEVIGEATKRLPLSIRDLAPAISWRLMAAAAATS